GLGFVSVIDWKMDAVPSWSEQLPGTLCHQRRRRINASDQRLHPLTPARGKFCLNFCRIGAKPGILDRRIEGAAQEDGPLRSKSRRTSKWTRDGGRSGKK